LTVNQPESYDSFAYAYDAALGLRFFRAVQPLLIESLEQRPPARRTHLDLACGTGLAVDFFSGRGFQSFGLDASLPMLHVARGRARRLIGGDMRALPLRGTFARVTCLYDSLNHLRNWNDLAAAFRGVARILDADGLFLFDVNDPEIYPAVWGTEEPFAAEGADYSLEIATTFRARDGMAQALVRGWGTLPNGERVSIRERRRQRAYTAREIHDALAAAGLAAVEVREFDPYRERRKVKLFWTAEQEARRRG
jgi:SAM-dependent methyltransferase